MKSVTTKLSIAKNVHLKQVLLSVQKEAKVSQVSHEILSWSNTNMLNMSLENIWGF